MAALALSSGSQPIGRSTAVGLDPALSHQLSQTSLKVGGVRSPEPPLSFNSSHRHPTFAVNLYWIFGQRQKSPASVVCAVEASSALRMHPNEFAAADRDDQFATALLGDESAAYVAGGWSRHVV